ncbi:MAG: hypothetical protein JNL96_13350 [Planctomycetaceae bacterium]|nr:hypothetical protein [Planctomycetaceae bacterium]
MKMLVRRAVALIAVAVLALLAVAAGPIAQASAEAPDVYMQNLLHEVGKGNGAALWNALPPSYQKDVNGIISQFSEKMDAEVWNGSFKTLGKLTKVLKDKKEFILGSPFLAAMPPEQLTELKNNWDGMVTSLDTVATSELKTLDGLKKIEIGQFLTATGNKLAGGLIEASVKANPQAAEGINKFRKAKVTLVSEEGDTAVLKMETEGEEPKEEKFTKVEGKWLPAEMVAEWSEGVTKAQEGLKTLEITPEQKAQVMAVTQMADGVLDKLQAAQTQEAFNTELQSIVALFGMFGGAGGGAPPAGLPPAPAPQ